MSHPKRADHFKKWAAMMLEQAVVPERLEYKRLSTSSRKRKSVKGGKTSRRFRRKRIRRMRKKQE